MILLIILLLHENIDILYLDDLLKWITTESDESAKLTFEVTRYHT